MVMKEKGDRIMTSDEKKQILFITSDYIPLFRVKDGENIVITHTDGTTLIRQCSFIDEYHVKVGNLTYHICQFAEQIEKCGAVINPEIPPRLPDKCFAQLPSTGEVIVVNKNENGYNPAPSYTTGSREKNYRIVAHENDRLGVSVREAAAMLGGSVFGWDKLAADPLNYDCYGKPDKKAVAQHYHEEDDRER